MHWTAILIIYSGVCVQGQNSDCGPLALMNIEQASRDLNPVLCLDIDTRQLRISQVLALTDGQLNDTWKVMNSPVKGNQDILSTPKHAQSPMKTPALKARRHSAVKRPLFPSDDPSCDSCCWSKSKRPADSDIASNVPKKPKCE